MEAIERVFKTLQEPVRLRLLAMLEREELAVQDLTEVLGLAQSSVSRHLGILKDAGLVGDRREGPFIYYRFLKPTQGLWQQAWELARTQLQKDPAARRDADALMAVLHARATRARNWFNEHAPEWDALRAVFDDDTHRARAIARLVPPDLRVADIGTGTGILALELARAGLRVVAIDQSEKMLDATRANAAAAGLADRIELRRGEIHDLPLSGGEVDAAFAHMVLQYVRAPDAAVREMARIVRPGGQVVLVDFVSHDREWMRKQLGIVWRGFAPDTVESWLRAVGLEQIRIDVHEPRAKSSELPSTLIASGRRSHAR
jgi:ArsR family transcriptional regulator